MRDLDCENVVGQGHSSPYTSCTYELPFHDESSGQALHQQIYSLERDTLKTNNLKTQGFCHVDNV